MLFEKLTKPFLKRKEIEIKNQSSLTRSDNVLNSLGGEELESAWFSGDRPIADYLNFVTVDAHTLLTEQALKIDMYRKLALHHSEVKNCIDEIVNEVVSMYDNSCPVSIKFNEENQKVKDAIINEFQNICRLLNLNATIYNIVEQGYIDGQLVFHLIYDDKHPKEGIKYIEQLDPRYLVYDREKGIWRYDRDNTLNPLYAASTPALDKLEFTNDEIVRVDFGLYENHLCLSYLEYAVKNANILKNLEDLLVPLRFSRSISRRVFNIDVGNLPPKRIDEVMQKTQNKFKYKKFYNVETGEITNQQHITTMVEDYWFPNRAGGKGTTVDLLDESGNLGEITDILYYVQKLYRSLNVPLSRFGLDSNLDHTFDFESTMTSKDDVKFFIFISKIRRTYNKALKEILKRQVISRGIMKETEFNERSADIEINFTSSNIFIEKMRQSNLRERVDLYAMVSPHIGKLYSAEYILKTVMGLGDIEIDEMMKAIKKEEKDPKFKKFYGVSEEPDF